MSATPNSDALNARAEAVIAGGVVSPARKTEQGLAFARGQGAYIWDVDGNQYIDYHAAFAPHLLGHNDPDVNAAVWRAMQDGWSLIGTGTTPWEVRLAELVCESVPAVERIQVLNSGSEATSAAIRLARAWTGRTDIIVMLGGYNGYHNDVARTVMPPLEATGPRVSPGEYAFLALSADIPEATRRSVHVVNYNDADSVEYVMRRYPIAGVILEPVLQNIGIVPPQPGYLAALRRLCDEYGALLLFDEVKTGFRSALGGYQAVAGVNPDLSVFGKAVANGYPLAVLGGRADVMNLVVDPDPARRVYIAGTYNAHPHATAAAIATLEKLRQSEGAIYDQLDATTMRLTSGLEQIFAERGITATVSRNASAFVAYFTDHQPVDWHDLNASHDWDFDRRYRRALIARGIYHFPVAVKQGSVSAAHTNEDIDRTLEVTREVLLDL